VVLTSERQAGKVYELGGTAFTMGDLASEVSRQIGRTIVYQDLPEAQYAGALASMGLPESFAAVLADTSAATARGDWFTDSTDLPQLIGRPSIPLADVVSAALRTTQTAELAFRD
jgi:NAD(P)H dehydrogenase (quinone)